MGDEPGNTVEPFVGGFVVAPESSCGELRGIATSAVLYGRDTVCDDLTRMSTAFCDAVLTATLGQEPEVELALI
jgi:hypothetical protein